MHISILLMEQIIELFIKDCAVSDYTVCYYQCLSGGLHFKNSERSFDCICGIGDFAVSFAVYHFCYGQAFPYE